MMKRQTIKFVGAALLGVAVFASCQDYTPDEQAIIKRKTVADYEKAFYAEFPNIDPEQNWGFGPMPICGEDVDITRGMNTNSNEWETVYHYEVPGGITPNPPGGTAPWGWSAGDISNYERAYVYWWFSTHQYPEPIEVSWTEFFVENVWGQPEHSNVSGDATNPETSGTSHYYGAIYSGMDNLHILDIGKPHTNSPVDKKIIDEATALQHGIASVSGDYEHINNFNASGGAKEQVMYAYDVLSEDWYYRESRGGHLPDHNNWTVRYINGNYYLGFDYWCEKKTDAGYAGDQNGTIMPDGYYNDWIIKLSSGKHIVDVFTRRIMCEDLGNTFDWDFNDLVFDVTVYNGEYGNGQSGYFAQITLQAAGGTLPIYIGQKDEAHEAHNLFGVPVTTPVNVDAVGGVNRAAVVFHLPLDNTYTITEQDVVINGETKHVMSFDPNQIPIYVTRADMADPATADNYILTAVKGKAPQKFACPCDTYWMKEFKNVEGIEGKQPAGHPNFAKWVGGTITNEDDAFITERRKTEGNFTVLYADAHGSPFSVSFSEDGNIGTIKPWKELWEGTKNDPLNAQFTEVRSYPNFVTTDGSPNIDNHGYTTYSTTFEAQAPYIYETVGTDDDPTAYTAKNMYAILSGGYANQEAVWGPYAKTVTLETNDGSKGYVLGSGYYAGGTNVLIQAVPRKFFKLDRWEDEDVQGGPAEKLVSRDANYTIVGIDRNRHLKAHFGPKGPSRVNVVINPANAGTPYLDHHQEVFQSGTNVPAGEHSMLVVAKPGYVFDNWNNDEDEWWNDLEFDVDGEDVTLIANFRVAKQFTLTAETSDASLGSVSGSGQYDEGTMVRFIANPNSGIKFIEWTDEDGTWVSSNAQFDFYPEDYYSSYGTEYKFIAHFESFTSYYPTVLTPTLNGPFNDGYSLLQAVSGLSNYRQCCLEVTYTGNGPAFGYGDWNQVNLPWVGQSTTTFIEIPTNQLRIISGGGNISKIVVRVKP